MYVLSIVSFLMLGGFLLLAAMRFGVPAMISDVYYQLQNCTGSEVVGDKRKRNYGWVFTAVIVASSLLMLIPLLDSGKGIQFLAFLGCAGLMFVGFVPRYLDNTEHAIHKTAAITAAIWCVGWCASVNLIPTILLAISVLIIYFPPTKKPKTVGYYWAEVAVFLDVYLTYWIFAL
ncbi:hypothetical protein JQM97_03355 [Prevotella hominis]|uniref:hypothetical protein n=1 Tax=Segatella hominis TaxID=2518605 RepID=UPI001F472113|nr:hypothetical protein [Segatella hominis]MCF2589995.1 hypothetical protein [Segatella hominis]